MSRGSNDEDFVLHRNPGKWHDGLWTGKRPDGLQRHDGWVRPIKHKALRRCRMMHCGSR